MKTLSFYYKNKNDITKFIKNNVLPDKEMLIQVFTSSTNITFIQKLQKQLNKYLNNPSIIGTTTDGIISSTGVATTNSTLISISIFDNTKIKTLITEHENKDYFATGKKIIKNLIKKDSKVFITFTDGLNTNGEEYLKGITSVDKNIIVAGGMAGDNTAFKITYVFNENKIVSNGAVGAILNSDKLKLLTEYSFDWDAIGIKMKITKSDKNRVYEINHKKAVEVYAEYLGSKTAKNLPTIGVEFPLIMEIDNMKIGRVAINKESDDSLLFAGNIKKDTEVRFGVGNTTTILNKTMSRINLLKSKQPESIFVYSCMGRRRFVPEVVKKEAITLNKITTTIGFYTYGEFFHKDQKNFLLNETTTFLALTENTFKNLKVQENKTIKNISTTLDTISHLTNKISKDFEYITKHQKEIIDKRVYELKKSYYKDMLTKLNNRNQLIADLNNNNNNNATLILLNIDNFREINGFYGNIVGDFILVEISKKLTIIMKSYNFKHYRLNADEFALFKKSKTKINKLETFIKNLNNELGRLIINYQNTELHIRLSIGAVSKKTNRPLAFADLALKQARLEKKSYCIYNDNLKLTEQYSQNIEMAIKIKNAIKNDKIIPYYQPIIDNNTQEIVKYEALVRLIDENNKVISPFFFLNISQKIRLYNEVTKAVIRHSFKKFHNTKYEFSVNLTINDIKNPEIINYIFKYIKKYNVANRLIFEITETDEIKNYKILLDFINKIKPYGVKIAIDDFGSGYSNFNYILKIKPDIIKIDGSIIKNIENDQDSFLITKTIVSFAKEMNIKTLAEFVENENILEITKNLGVDYSQGYYFSPPKKDI